MSSVGVHSEEIFDAMEILDYGCILSVFTAMEFPTNSIITATAYNYSF